jgi:DNA recombination protein RmuC
MNDVLFVLGGHPVTTGEMLLALAAAALVLLITVTISLRRAGQRRAMEADDQEARADALEDRLADLMRAQAEASGRMQTLAEILGTRQAELQQAVTERLDSVSHRLSERMQYSAETTNESLSQLNERLAVVDAAQARLAELSSHMVTLKDVLANKQARGAFGQGRMEAIVSDGLPKDAFAFQFTLSNGKRPDCAVFLPGDERPLIIDAKFPLEAITAFREARTDEERKVSSQRLRTDIQKHVSDIADRYFLPGETQEMALMFVPSESVYADLHEHFDDLVQKAFRSRVLLVSPSLLMMAVQVLQAIVKDARMREAAEQIRDEVGKLMGDVNRLRDRAYNLQKHFAQASDDVGQVLISADKVAKRGAQIEALELDDASAAEAPLPPLNLRLGAAE